MSMSNWADFGTVISVHLFINYSTITNYILIMYELSNFDHVLGLVSQIRVSGGNRIHDHHANSLVHYPLDNRALYHQYLFSHFILKIPINWFRVTKTICYHSIKSFIEIRFYNYRKVSFGNSIGIAFYVCSICHSISTAVITPLHYCFSQCI